MKYKKQEWNKENIKDYLKCVYANKFTLAGYIGLTSAFTAIIFKEPLINQITHEAYAIIIGITFGYSMFSLGVTSFGTETLDSYKRTKNNVNKYGTINDVYYYKHSMYCNKVGVKLALKEAGLEKILEEK